MLFWYCGIMDKTILNLKLEVKLLDVIDVYDTLYVIACRNEVQNEACDRIHGFVSRGPNFRPLN